VVDQASEPFARAGDARPGTPSPVQGVFGGPWTGSPSPVQGVFGGPWTGSPAPAGHAGSPAPDAPGAAPGPAGQADAGARTVRVQSAYFWREWAPRLGPYLTVLIVQLRNMCYYNPATGERRDWCFPSQETLARACGVSVSTLYRLLRDPRLAPFVRVEERYRYDARLGKRVRASNLYHVRLDDPLTPEHGARPAGHPDGQVHPPAGHPDGHIARSDCPTYSAVRLTGEEVLLRDTLKNNTRPGGGVPAQAPEPEDARPPDLPATKAGPVRGTESLPGRACPKPGRSGAHPQRPAPARTPRSGEPEDTRARAPRPCRQGPPPRTPAGACCCDGVHEAAARPAAPPAAGGAAPVRLSPAPAARGTAPLPAAAPWTPAPEAAAPPAAGGVARPLPDGPEHPRHPAPLPAGNGGDACRAELRQALLRRGVSAPTAHRLAAAYPPERIRAQLAHLERLPAPPRNPAGWLRQAIIHDYTPPPPGSPDAAPAGPCGSRPSTCVDCGGPLETPALPRCRRCLPPPRHARPAAPGPLPPRPRGPGRRDGPVSLATVLAELRARPAGPAPPPDGPASPRLPHSTPGGACAPV
jgi:hypothetical protein